MIPLTPPGDLELFWPALESARERVLMLDYDGTLAPFSLDRDRALPYEGVREALVRIRDAGRTRLAVVSGRAAHDVTRLLAMDPPPDIWGSHGWERIRPDGAYRLEPLPPDAEAELRRHRCWVEESGLGQRLETKPRGLALHWRGLDDGERDRIRGLAAERERSAGGGQAFEFHSFDGGVEIRARGRTKADAVRSIVKESSASAVRAYLGDDQTDEEAFVELRGAGLRILVRAEQRETDADVVIRPPEELLAFLHRWHNIVGSER